VCLSVREDMPSPTEPHARSLPIIFSVHVAYGRGWVLLRQGDEISRGMGSTGGFFHIDNAL